MEFLNNTIKYNLPYGYTGSQYEYAKPDFLEGKSDIEPYAEAQAFWNECIKSERQRVMNGVELKKIQERNVNVNQPRIDQMKADGPLNTGGFIMEESLPMAFESKIELYDQTYGRRRMRGGQIPTPDAGMITWIPENWRQDLIQLRLQSLEEQDQVAELNDPSIEEGASELDMIQEGQTKISNLLRLINAQLIGGLIDKSILTNLSEIMNILSQYAYGFSMSYLQNLITQLNEEPGLMNADVLEGYRLKGRDEQTPEGQAGLIRAISEYASDIEDVLQILVSDQYQNLNIEERKMALSAVVSEFRKKTASIFSSEPVEMEELRPQSKADAIRDIVSYIRQQIEDDNSRPLEISIMFGMRRPGREQINIEEEDLEGDFDQEKQLSLLKKVRNYLSRVNEDRVFELWNELQRYAQGVPGEEEEQEFEEGMEQVEAPIESGEAVIPESIEPLQPLELPGESESKGEEDPFVPSSGEQLDIEAQMRRAREIAEQRGEPSSDPAPSVRPPSPISPPPPRMRRRIIPRPASAVETSLAEELGERLFEESQRQE
jgi:hypothetical protein